jgi:hypothetical protein
VPTSCRRVGGNTRRNTNGSKREQAFSVARELAHEQRIVSAQVSAADASRLEQLAREHDRTLSAEIRRAVREHVARETERTTA